MALRERVQNAFPFLFHEHGFVFLDHPGADDETVLIAGSSDMLIRFIVDRADFFVDVGDARTPEMWTSLYEVLDAMKRAGRVVSSYKYANTIAASSSVLRENVAATKQFVLRGQ